MGCEDELDTSIEPGGAGNISLLGNAPKYLGWVRYPKEYWVSCFLFTFLSTDCLLFFQEKVKNDQKMMSTLWQT